MKVTIHEDAAEEARDHVAWYTARNPVVGQRLAIAFDAMIEQISQKPHGFGRLEYGRNPGNLRRARVKKFPIMILFQHFDDEIIVIAVAHTSRRPGYWRNRLRKQ